MFLFNNLVNFTSFMNHHPCDAPKPEGPLTTRQPAEDLWMSDKPTPHHRVPFSGTHDLTKIGQSLLCTESSTQNITCTKKKLGNMTQYNTITPLGPIMSESGLTEPTQVYPKAIHKSLIYNSHFYTKYIYNQSFSQIRDKKKKQSHSRLSSIV